ncbi:uncharacterized protein [Nicotiana tomentosiformis]|uniref:uncharacterized protein n=1 Tax=Nicotiana tomentosiformis TaxID=4098 RepID=UPI00388C50AA
MASSSKNVSSSKGKNKAEDAALPTVNSIIPRSLVIIKDFKDKFPPALRRTWAVGRYPSSLHAGSVVVPKEDVLADPADAARLLQDVLTRTCVSRHASGISVSLRSPRSEDKKTKRRRSSAPGEKNKGAKTVAPESSPVVMVTSPPPGPVIDTVMIDDDGEASDGGAFLHRRQRSSSTQQNAQPVEPTFLLPRSFRELEAKATEAVVLEARLQQIRQEVETLSQEIAPLRVQFEKAKAKWIEVHNAVLAASDHEAASAERLTNLEVVLNSKTEELAAAGAKHSQLEEKYRKTIEHNRIISSTVRDLDVSLKSVRSARESLFAEVTQLREELKRRAASLFIEKTNTMYIIRRKTLEEAKSGIIDFDAEIAKAHELELVAKYGLPTEPAAFGSSGSSSKTSGTEEEAEDKNVEGQIGEGQNVELSADLSNSPGGANTSLPLDSGDAAILLFFSFSNSRICAILACYCK